MAKVLKVSPVLVERARQEVRQLESSRKPVSEGLRRVSQVRLTTDPERSTAARRAAPQR